MHTMGSNLYSLLKNSLKKIDFEMQKKRSVSIPCIVSMANPFCSFVMQTIAKIGSLLPPFF